MPYQVIKNLKPQFKGFLFWNRQVRALRLGLESQHIMKAQSPKNRSWSKTFLSEVLFTGPQVLRTPGWSPLRHSIILVIK